MRSTTLFSLATCLAFTGIRPIARQELTPLDRTPPTLKSMYYDVNGDGKMEYLDTENNKERFTAWFALDGTVVERVADDVLTIDHLLELNGDGKPDFIASDGNDTKMYLSQPDGSYKATSCPSLGSQLTQADLNRDGRMDLVFFKRIKLANPLRPVYPVADSGRIPRKASPYCHGCRRVGRHGLQ